LKTLLLILFLHTSLPDFPVWENCKNWWNEQYTKFFPNTPKTHKERIDWANSVYKKAILNNDSLLLAEAYYLLGKAEFHQKKDYLKTKYWFLKSLALQEKIGLSSKVSRVNVWLSYNEQDYHNYKQTLNYLQRAVHIAELINDEEEKAGTYSILAEFYSSQLFSESNNRFSVYDSAEIYAEKAKISALKVNHIGALSLLSIRESATDYKSRIKALEEALQNLDPSTDYSTYKVTALLKLTNLYIDIDRLDIAEIRLEEAKKALAKLSELPFIKREIETVEIRLLVKRKNYEDAYFLLQNLRNEENTKWSNERLRVMNNVEDGLQKLIAENQETEISLHRENIQLQNKFLWVSVFLIAVSLITAGLFFLLSRKNRQISKQNALLVQEQNHRFNNNLQTISSLLTLKSNELNTADAKTVFSESKLLIQAIASLQRKLYSSDKLVSVDLHHLIPEVVSEVLAAFNMGKVKTIFEIPPLEVYADDALNLNLIFTELTINACKHAFNTTSEPLLKISMNATDEQIEFCFRDNGSEKVNYSTQSFGMFLIKQLVKQMQGSHKFYYDNGTVCEVKCKVKILA
jgi:two-component sensor histidine kinase